VLGSAEFEAGTETHSFGLPTSWKHPDPKPVSSVAATTIQIGSNVFGLPITNIGLGAAKNVTINWTFPIENAVAVVDKCAKEAGLDNFLQFDGGVLKMESPMIASFWINQKTQTTDYVLPASVPGAVIPLSLPNAYILLVSAAVSLNFYSKIKELGGRPELLEPPALVAAFTFDDIAGKRHTVLFDLEVSIRGATGMGRFDGYVEASRRKTIVRLKTLTHTLIVRPANVMHLLLSPITRRMR
jgi:hypothetical protein